MTIWEWYDISQSLASYMVLDLKVERYEAFFQTEKIKFIFYDVYINKSIFYFVMMYSNLNIKIYININN